MQIYDFDKNRKRVKKELNLKLEENKAKLRRNNLKVNVINGEKKDVYEINDAESSFIYVNNKIIGIKDFTSKLIYKSISNKKIMCNKFSNCEFNSVKFENCTFHGTLFENCKFNKVNFSHCDFYDNEGSIGIFQNHCIFNNCIFEHTNLKNMVFQNSDFIKIKFIFTSLRNAIFDECNINRILFSDCNLKAMKIIETHINVLRFEDKYLSKVDENTFIDKININENYDYDNLFKTYKSISSIYESNRYASYGGEYYYLAKCMERKSLKGLERFKSNIFWIICGYGERPTFALVTSFEIVLLFAIMYMFSGLCINGSTINYSFNILYLLPKRAIYLDFIKCFYFSLVTFTSVGYGDIFPTGYSVIFSCFEMILGVTMVGVWTATLARKIIR
ncbi:MAG: pentapeptide repeat-containing protein [Terrisporobacter sp.]